MSEPARIAWIDARVGVAGDMLAAACVAAGADATLISAAVSAATGGDVDIRFEEVVRGGLVATRARVTVRDADAQPHRRLADIIGLLCDAPLDAQVRSASIEVFTAIAEVEAACHGLPVAEVHFHEVGAWDSIADVVAVMAAWASLGWPETIASEIGVGSGLVTGAHGGLSVPAPAVTGLLAQAGLPSWSGPLPFEAATPTGVALVARLSSGRHGGMPPMTVRHTGLGAGSANPEWVANVTRVVLGQAVGAPEADVDHLVELQANIDDLDPRLAPGVVDALLRGGALDAWWTPIVMKRGRPAQQLRVLCRPEDAADLRTAVFRLTPTLGVRWHALARHALDRRYGTVAVGGHTIAVKIGVCEGDVVTCQPEWRDVQRAADALGLEPRQVLSQASAVAWTEYGRRSGL